MKSFSQAGTSRDPQRRPRILALIVLYKMKAEDSPAYKALKDISEREQEICELISCVICDNTPIHQELPFGFPESNYYRDTSNPGLAKSYNHALQIAQESGAEWLLLLDQDTTPTAAYVKELVYLSTQTKKDKTITSLVPKLVQCGAVLSPHWPLGLQFRRPKSIPLDQYGVVHQRVCVFNSGALLRVSALLAVGGFPEKFWLDYLDHATFHALRKVGGKIFVMHSRLEHQLWTNDANRTENAISEARERNIFLAERMFYQEHGRFMERVYYSLFRLRLIAGAIRRQNFRRLRMLIDVTFR